MTEYTPTVGELRQAYVEASGASMAQESYYAEQVAEFERGIARIKAEAWDEGQSAHLGYEQDRSHPLTSKPVPVPVNPYRAGGWTVNWDEKVAARFDPGDYATPLATYLGGANDMRNRLLSDEAILRALNAEEPRVVTRNLADWSEQSVARMRRALTAAIGDDDE